MAGLGVTHYMESTSFCGQACHEPMQPEFTAHQVSSHSNVGCVSCHVGPGARGTIKAKMNGIRQMTLYFTGTHNRPIPVPAHGLPVAADTCERCHTPGHADRDSTRIVRAFADDEANTESTSEVVLHMAKNHWHARKDITVEYVTTDAKRKHPIRARDRRGRTGHRVPSHRTPRRRPPAKHGVWTASIAIRARPTRFHRPWNMRSIGRWRWGDTAHAAVRASRSRRSIEDGIPGPRGCRGRHPEALRGFL